MKTPYNRALDLLAARAYSSRDLHRKLVQKGATPDDADAVITRLTENGLLDDRKYALAYARTKLLGGSASPRRIRQDLSKKGVAAPVAAEALSQLEAEEEVDVRGTLERLVKKKLAQMATLPPPTQRRRLYSYLARRGYDMNDIQAVAAPLIAMEGGEMDP